MATNCCFCIPLQIVPIVLFPKKAKRTECALGSELREENGKSCLIALILPWITINYLDSNCQNFPKSWRSNEHKRDQNWFHNLSCTFINICKVLLKSVINWKLDTNNVLRGLDRPTILELYWVVKVHNRVLCGSLTRTLKRKTFNPIYPYLNFLPLHLCFSAICPLKSLWHSETSYTSNTFSFQNKWFTVDNA